MALYMPPQVDPGTAAADVAERVRASVVEVRSGRAGAGAGTIWARDGIVVTNHHVVPWDQAEIALVDGRRLVGSVVARDPQNDLAIVKVDALGLPAASIGDARRLRAGELVMAFGHPFGLRGAVTIGIVSTALSAADGQIRELIRADVWLGPGNSGGPLVEARGRVVGINAMVAGGMALAVPSHVVERLLGQAARMAA